MPLRLLAALLLVASTSQADDDIAARLIGAELSSGRAMAIVRALSDGIGQRLTGSANAARAVAWAKDELQRDGLTNLRLEPVTVEKWVRGEESAEIVAPSFQPLHAVALGGSIGTPSGGVTAEVLPAASFDELRAAGPRVKGKIVLWTRAMGPGRVDASDYGEVSPLRNLGAAEAARLGAVASLVRSVGVGHHQLPHTGATRYDPAGPKIPAAAVTAEDCELIERLLSTGQSVRVRLRLGARTVGTAPSANVVGEIVGREHPEEIVVLGAHLDSWDLGTGAIDDGAGCAIVIEAARLIAALGQKPRRTLRVVLFMAEERGLSGAKAYAAQHAAELPRHFAALEADSGAGRPWGLIVAGEAAVEPAKALLPLLAGLGVSRIIARDEAGSDVGQLQAGGVPTIAVAQDATSYFEWHHTAADTVDKIEPRDLALDAAAVAVLAWQLGESTARLPAPLPPARR